MSTPTRGHLVRSEIAEQPAVAERVLSAATSAGGELTRVAARLREAAPRTVLLTARGTSDHAALYAKYLVEVGLGLPAGLTSTSTLTVYGATPDLTGVLWIAVSQSGGSPDLVESTAAARRAGALTLAVTNDPASPLAAAAELHLDVHAGPELAVAATKSYTAQLLTLWLLITTWRGAGTTPAHDVPGALERAVATDDVAPVATRYRFVDRLVLTARGYSYPTAREAALKLMETSYLSAQAFSAADLMHGPLAVVDADRPVIAVVPDGPGGRAMTPVLDALRQRGADVCAVAPDGLAPDATVRLAVPGGIREDLAPIVQIVPLQRLALEMALARGLDPDAPRGLRKVTETR
ncbi:SIS domain-containing protein [Paenibacillus sp. TRM 82003]|uniref:SIS domain-containing protein n=1 Tax=Kineococcus sp. TRM81007 TaxID=2925831 RepID=UPI001F59E5D0|nr:SIS domain-containing protein [Kineococcus sp. TRM81007]MCI2237526.1 SIS domain-containing protein [Kineococcus sp. TRM81007]MCI3919880.1 SIS domain-containing protein [Paenibacillus sp. TRM 82003]